MKRFTQLTSLWLALTILSAFAFAQTPPAPKPGNTPVKIESPKSLATIPAGEKFTSAEGRFSIALPKDGAEFEKTVPREDSPRETGGSYSWTFKEGVIAVNYSDDPDLVVKTEQDYADLAEGMRAGVAVFGGTIVSEKAIKLGEYRGYEIRLESPEKLKGLSRVFIAGGRKYLVFCLIFPDPPGGMELATKVFDSFEVIAPDARPATSFPPGISAEVKKIIDDNTPAALPQEPAAKREGTDAGDDNLKGKVKTVIEETENLDRPAPRHFSSIEDYDTRGNRLKRVSFDSSRNPWLITVYGHIDGARVSRSKSIGNNDDPPPPAAAAPPAPAPPAGRVTAAPRDQRYEYKHEYTYADAKPIEMQLFGNNGKIVTRKVYNRKGNEVEILVYTPEGELNQRFLDVLDNKGNEIEHTIFDQTSPKMFGDRKYITRYDEFDTNGNWTKKTVFRAVLENGKEVNKPSYIKYRTITYYP